MKPDQGIRIILLAAGAGKRMGGLKPLTRLGQQTFLKRQLQQLMPLDLPITVIVGAEAQIVAGEVRNVIKKINSTAIDICLNQQWQQGMATSLQLAVSQYYDNQALLFIAIDQIAIKHKELSHLVSLWNPETERPVAASYQGTVGIPAIIPQYMYSQINALSGEKGAKTLLLNAANLQTVALASAAIDIDTPEQLQKFLIDPKNFNRFTPI